jgi:exonuclease VII small subunit
MKKRFIVLVLLGAMMTAPANAQWNSWNTSSTISGVFGAINHSIESAERKKQMEIYAKEKAQYEQSFKEAMESARDFEGGEYWEDALTKYEEAAKLNCKYGYTDQMQITRKINDLYVKAGRTEEGPSILNNNTTILADYSKYRYVRENPIYVNKKSTTTKIVRVACSDTETRLEMEFVCSTVNDGASIKGTTYIKGNKGGKLGLEGVENITMAPNSTRTPWPGQKLRFVLIFPPLPDNATEFDLIEPSTDWKFKDIKCK